MLFSTVLPSTYAADSTQSQNASDSTQPNSSAGSSSGSTGTGAQASGNGTTVMMPMVVLMPMQIQSDQNLANGCWVRLFNGTNFKGNDELTIAGPMDMQSLDTGSGILWGRKADSLEVGPKASVTVFENKLFRDKTLTFSPGQQVPNLRKDLGFLHSIDSLKVACTG
jgi:hypothetical protein